MLSVLTCENTHISYDRDDDESIYNPFTIYAEYNTRFVCKILISADLKTSCRHNQPIRITYISCFRTDKSSMRSQMTKFHIYQALMGIFRHTSLYLYVDDKAYTWLLERHMSKLQKLTNLPHLFVVVQTVG